MMFNRVRAIFNIVVATAKEENDVISYSDGESLWFEWPKALKKCNNDLKRSLELIRAA
jgi:hypothetical protein